MISRAAPRAALFICALPCPETGFSAALHLRAAGALYLARDLRSRHADVSCRSDRRGRLSPPFARVSCRARRRIAGVPSSAAEPLMSYAPLVKRVAPAVVNVYAARVVENRNPLLDDPMFRRFFGQGVPREQVQRSLGSGVIVDASGLVMTNNHVIANATEVKVSLADKRELEAEIVLKDERTDLAVLRIKNSNERFPALAVRQFRRSAGRRRRARHRQSVQRRPDRDARHRLGGRAHAGRHHRLSVLHPDRRRHQSRQFRRRAGRFGGASGRHQHRDLLAHRRLDRHRLRDPGQHGARGRELRQGRRQRGAAALARRALAGGDAGNRRNARPETPGRRIGRGSFARRSGRQGGTENRRSHRRGRRAGGR